MPSLMAHALTPLIPLPVSTSLPNLDTSVVLSEPRKALVCDMNKFKWYILSVLYYYILYESYVKRVGGRGKYDG